MDALVALQNRASSPRLIEPGPTIEALEEIKKSALRAADHCRLRPWRFLVIEGDSRKKLGELFIATEKQKISNVTENKCELLAKKAMRAPTIVIVIASLKQHPVVPEIEQIISAGAAAQNMLNAAYAMGLGAVWRTGEVAYDMNFSAGLGLGISEKIIGFLYLGTIPVGRETNASKINTNDYFKDWP